MIEAIVLAAGKGERLGAIKPLIRIDGESALTRVIERAHAAGVDQIIVVLGHKAEVIRQEIDLAGCRVVINPDYESGMGSSLALGISALSRRAEGFLILHADMPYIREETVRAVLARAEAGAHIIAPIYRGRRGFPVYLRRSCCEELLSTLVGETGARAFIASHPNELVLVEVDDSGCIWDIDRMEDLRTERFSL